MGAKLTYPGGVGLRARVRATVRARIGVWITLSSSHLPSRLWCELGLLRPRAITNMAITNMAITNMAGPAVGSIARVWVRAGLGRYGALLPQGWDGG